MTQKFAYMVLHEPGMCDFNGEKVNQRGVGIFNMRKIFHALDKRNGIITDEQALDEFIEYYDVKNFARHINKDCIVRVSVGFLDHACTPSCVYAVYNSLKVEDKKIFNDIHAGHQGTDTFREQILWMQNELRKKCNTERVQGK